MRNIIQFPDRGKDRRDTNREALDRFIKLYGTTENMLRRRNLLKCKPDSSKKIVHLNEYKLNVLLSRLQ